MYGRNWAKLVLISLGVVGTTAAWAGPTGLLIIPIADILGHGEAAYTYALSGNERNIDKGYVHGHGLQLGVADRIEFGFDNDFFGGTTYNAKMLLVDDKKDGRYALSFGLLNMGDTKGDMYLVGRYNLSERCRLHCGYMQSGDNRPSPAQTGQCPGSAWPTAVGRSSTFRERGR